MPGNADVMWDRLFKLEPDSGIRLQDQIRQQMVSAIAAGRLPVDSPVPSGRDLAQRLGVARNTVVLAYQHLVDEGYLLARKRSGYFVNPEMCGAPPRTKASDATPSSSDHAPNWPRRMRLHPSGQRNISKAHDWQNFRYPFIYGQFDPALFPTNDWRECCQKVVSVMEIRDWAGDLFTRDDPSLIEQIRTKVLPSRGVWAQPEEIIVTIGAQQALYLLADLLVDPATHVGIENPGYPDARNIFLTRTLHLEPLAIDEGGLIVGPHLAGLDYVYATPSHQSPTTVTMPIERRDELLRLADAEDFIVIEDDYESETRFSGKPTPALKSLDSSGRVVYVGSLSKTLAPGLRLGYVVGPAPLVAELRALRRLMIRHPAALIQRSFALFLALGHHGAHARRLANAHRERAGLLAAALQRHLPMIKHTTVNGGSSFWLEGPRWLDSRQLAAGAAERSILIEPGDVFFMADKPPRNTFRLGLSSIPADRIEPGIKLLAEVVREQKS